MNRPNRTASAREILYVLLASTALTILVALPVLSRPSERLFGSEIDGFHPDAYIVLDQMESPPAFSHITQPATDWLAAALGRIFGVVPAFNLLILLTFPLAAVCAYLLARAISLGVWSSAFVAVLFAFSPFHLAHAAYHPHIAQIQWVPLYLLAIWLCLERFSVARGVLLAAATALLVMSNFYAGLIGMVITPVAMVGFWWAIHGGDLRAGRRALGGTVAVLAGVASMGALYVSRLDLSFDSLAVSYEELFRYCARWWSYLVPSVEHPLTGEWASGLWERHGIGSALVEQQVFLGWSVLALAAVAVAAHLSGRRFQFQPRLVPALLAIAAVAFLFSLPPDGRVLGFARPTAWLHAWLPMFRAYARFGLVVQLATLLLAAIGLSVLLERDRKWARAAAATLVLLAVVELTPIPPWRWHWLLPTEAHRLAEAQTEPMKILDCHEMRPGERFRLGRMHHDISLPRGDAADCAEDGLAAKLAALDYTHLLIRSDYRFADLRFGDAQSSDPKFSDPYPSDPGPLDGLEVVADFPDSRLLAITATAAPVYVGSIGGASWREAKGDRTFRWLSTRASLALVNAEEEAACGSLNLELGAFPQERQVAVHLPGGSVAHLVVGQEPEVFDLGPFDLEPGRHSLQLISAEPAVSPDSILQNGDQREVAVSLWSWTWQPCPAAVESLD